MGQTPELPAAHPYVPRTVLSKKHKRKPKDSNGCLSISPPLRISDFPRSSTQHIRAFAQSRASKGSARPGLYTHTYAWFFHRPSHRGESLESAAGGRRLSG